MAKTGRPTKYSEKLIDEICAKIATGMSLRSICNLPDMPVAATVWRWLGNEDYFKEQYAKSKAESSEADHERLANIVDDVLNDTIEPQQARVAADIIKWSMGKKKPKKYGDKIQQEHSGEINTTKDMTKEELEQKLKDMGFEKK